MFSLDACCVGELTYKMKESKKKRKVRIGFITDSLRTILNTASTCRAYAFHTDLFQFLPDTPPHVTGTPLNLCVTQHLLHPYCELTSLPKEHVQIGILVCTDESCNPIEICLGRCVHYLTTMWDKVCSTRLTFLIQELTLVCPILVSLCKRSDDTENLKFDFSSYNWLSPSMGSVPR